MLHLKTRSAGMIETSQPVSLDDHTTLSHSHRILNDHEVVRHKRTSSEYDLTAVIGLVEDFHSQLKYI